MDDSEDTGSIWSRGFTAKEDSWVSRIIQPHILSTFFNVVCLYEVLGTMLFIYISGMVFIHIKRANDKLHATTAIIDSEDMTCTRVLTVSVSEGLLYFALLASVMHVTQGEGGYLNPVVAVSVFVVQFFYSKKLAFQGIHLQRCVLYILSQTIGAFIAGMLLDFTLSSQVLGIEKLGQVVLNLDVGRSAGVLLEAIAASVLVFVILTVRINEERRASFIIALVYIAVKMLCFPVTGGAFSFLRYWSVALFTGNWRDVNVYLQGNVIGAVIALGLFVGLRHSDIANDAETNIDTMCCFPLRDKEFDD